MDVPFKTRNTCPLPPSLIFYAPLRLLDNQAIRLLSSHSSDGPVPLPRAPVPVPDLLLKVPPDVPHPAMSEAAGAESALPNSMTTRASYGSKRTPWRYLHVHPVRRAVAAMDSSCGPIRRSWRRMAFATGISWRWTVDVLRGDVGARSGVGRRDARSVRACRMVLVGGKRAGQGARGEE
jgi:hypothetical protein